MWDGIVGALASIIEFFYGLTGNFGVAVIIFTLIVKGVLLPLDIKSKKSSAKIQAINPEIQRISEKYKNDPQKRAAKMNELYAKHHVSPMSGCLPLLISMPVLILLFAGLRSVAADHMYAYMEGLLIANDAGMKDFLADMAAKVSASSDIKLAFTDILPTLFNNSGNATGNLAKLPEILGQENFDVLSNAIKAVRFDDAMNVAKESGYSFLWIKNIWVADSPLKSVLGTSASFFSAICNGWFILPILSTATQYLQTYLMQRDQKKKNKGKKQDQTQASMNKFTMFLPLLSLYFCAVYNSAFAIYYTISNIVAISQTLITNYIMKRKENKENGEVINL